MQIQPIHFLPTPKNLKQHKKDNNFPSTNTIQQGHLPLFAYKDYNLSFKARLNRTPENFYEQKFNIDNMPATVKKYLLEDFEERHHMPPAQLQREAFEYLKLADSVQDVKDKSFVEIIEKKTGKYKKFPLNKKIQNLLREYIDENDEGSDPLFMTIYNNRLDRTSAYRIINTACRQAGITDNIGTHTLRKTFGYHHYRQFKDIALLQKIFNHHSPGVTLRYIGIDQEEINQSYINFIL